LEEEAAKVGIDRGANKGRSLKARVIFQSLSDPQEILKRKRGKEAVS
jgi:hypothetical protein